MKGSYFKGLLVCWLTCLLFCPFKDAEAAVFTDSLTFKIDSAKVEGNDLVYSIMFWRTNKDWTGGGIAGVQDTMLGNTDLYFRIEDVVFDKTDMPSILRHHPHVDLNTAGGTVNVLNISALYYAYRFAVKLTPKPSLAGATQTVGIPYNEPVELCQIRMKMANPTQNPGLVWDTPATGGQSTIGEPLILTLQGDIEYNPKKDIVLVDYSRRQYVCEGGGVKSGQRAIRRKMD